MNQRRSRYSLTVVAAAIGLIVGVVTGLLVARQLLGGMDETNGHEMKKGEMNDMPMKGMGMPGMSGDPAGAVAIPTVARQLIGVRSAPAAYATLKQEIRAVGAVGYDERGLTQVTLKTSGWVREVFVDSIGRPVRKGEPLLTFYSPDLLATQDEYLLALNTQAQLSDSPLAEVKANAASLVAGARDRLRLWDLTDAQIAALEHRGRAEPVLTVYAPSSGVVLTREALPGKYVEPGTTLYEIVDLSKVWIIADIYESEVAAVKLNQPATIAFAAYPGETFRGRVGYVYPSLNVEARTVRVRFELSNPGLKLKPGMYGTVTVRTDSVKTLAVPKEAVLETGLRQLVFVDRGRDRYEPASVKLGRRSQDYVEVIEGLQAGERVSTSANFLLDAESKLTSASSMQGMMGRIGMADWQMRGAYEGKMEGMDMGKGGVSAPPGRAGEKGEMKGMQRMKGMESMPGMEMRTKKEMTVAETRQTAGATLALTTSPEKPKAGEVLLRLKVTDQAGKVVTNAHVMFVYTMPMPGMTDSKAMASHTKDGLYEGKALFGMGGTWVVTVNVTIPGQSPFAEKFQFSVTGGGR